MNSTSNTRRVASNSFWYGIEMAIGLATVLATTIPLARVIGPDRLGYFSYVGWLTNVSAAIGSLGITLAMRKYMAESLGNEDGSRARAVYRTTLRLQSLLALALTATGLVLVFTVARTDSRWVSAFLVLSMLPAMVGSVPSQANMAGERMKVNTIGSLVANTINIASVTSSLLLGWDLLGVAIGMFLYRTVDCLYRSLSVLRWLGRYAIVPLDSETKERMKRFSGYSLIQTLLHLVVWDRSEMIFLRYFSSSDAQITFYALAFNMTEKLQLVPNALSSGIGARLFAQYGTDRDRVPQLTATSMRYILLCAVPFMLGLAALSPVLIPLVYGDPYRPAVTVVVISATFAIARGLMHPVRTLMQATENQARLTVWLISCALLNLVLDVILIPAHGAVGAAVANGVSQAVMVWGIWFQAKRLFQINVRWLDLVKIALAGGIMTAIVHGLQRLVEGWWFVTAAVMMGTVTYVATLRLTQAFDKDDRWRLEQLQARLPKKAGPVFRQLLRFLIPVGV